jgi:deoxyribodipyrimidine photolyase-like uncharacterized protein
MPAINLVFPHHLFEKSPLLKHRDFFTQNPRLGMLIKTFDKMPDEKHTKILDTASNFLDKLD